MQILIPLHKKGRGRPKKVTNVQSLPGKRARGRPRNQVKKVDEKIAESPDDLDPQVGEVDVNDNKVEPEGILSELRILGGNHILSKVFVSEAMTCGDPIEPHVYDILDEAGKPLPCYYCGDVDQKSLFSL